MYVCFWVMHGVECMGKCVCICLNNKSDIQNSKSVNASAIVYVGECV